MPDLKVLFVCNANKLRSPTAERIFRERPGLEVKSAGVDEDATVTVNRETLEWADLIFVMEKRQRNVIHKKFKDIYEKKPIVCLYIPDVYDLMQPELIELLMKRVLPHLNQ
ncbi:phosphotyrosine protein phosphatase [bacterium]|nr:phosphotyrosine protein phosphatase [bacterium]MCI0601536.1 phosphotyrosine protein phosphatase [bacterium]